MRLRKYKSTLIDKGLYYFISVKLLILETIVSQRPWWNMNYSLNLVQGRIHQRSETFSEPSKGKQYAFMALFHNESIPVH